MSSRSRRSSAVSITKAVPVAAVWQVDSTDLADTTVDVPDDLADRQRAATTLVTAQMPALTNLWMQTGKAGLNGMAPPQAQAQFANLAQRRGDAYVAVMGPGKRDYATRAAQILADVHDAPTLEQLTRIEQSPTGAALNKVIEQISLGVCDASAQQFRRSEAFTYRFGTCPEPAAAVPPLAARQRAAELVRGIVAGLSPAQLEAAVCRVARETPESTLRTVEQFLRTPLGESYLAGARLLAHDSTLVGYHQEASAQSSDACIDDARALMHSAAASAAYRPTVAQRLHHLGTKLGWSEN